ncbi:MAG: hypothetical protein IJR85_03355 [Synergistaceae bacterium]|nr:hypothetical protein [Synergistaceae bacterium]
MKKAVKAAEKAKLTVTLDANTKKDFAQLCEDIGLPMGAVICALMSQAVRKQALNISALDINGFTPREAKELLRRWEDLKAMRDRERAAALG